MDITSKNIIPLFLSFSLTALGQDNTPTPVKKHSVFLELGGQSMYASISYDRLLTVDKKVNTSASVGLALLPLKGYFFLNVPIGYNFILGQKSHHLDFGPGVNFLTETYGRQTYNLVYFTPKIAYRFQRSTGGLFFKFSFIPTMLGVESYSKPHARDFYYNSIIYNPDNDWLNWWFGLAIGRTF